VWETEREVERERGRARSRQSSVLWDDVLSAFHEYSRRSASCWPIYVLWIRPFAATLPKYLNPLPCYKRFPGLSKACLRCGRGSIYRNSYMAWMASEYGHAFTMHRLLVTTGRNSQNLSCHFLSLLFILEHSLLIQSSLFR